MKRFLFLVLVLALAQSARAQSAEEKQMVEQMRAGATAQQMDAFCARLKNIGTVHSVPVVASLLKHEQLSHSARFALESMNFPEAGQALIQALDQTSGLTQVGIITSLGNRREAQAAPALTKMLGMKDPAVASAAAIALGRIGSIEAANALLKVLTQAADPAQSAVLDSRSAIIDGLLNCADQSLAKADTKTAQKIYAKLNQAGEKDYIRIAAYQGLIRCAGPKADDLIEKALRGSDTAAQLAALQAIRELKEPAITKVALKMLPTANPATQLALVEALRQRGDITATPAMIGLATAKDPSLRVAALQALGEIGDASAVPVLAVATAGPEPELKAARLALLRANRGPVTQAILQELNTAKPAVQAELVRALAGRADTGTVPQLLDLAKNGGDTAQKAACRALGLMADVPHLPALVELLVNARSEDARGQAQDALAAVCQRVQSRNPRFDASPIVSAYAKATAPARIALLPVYSLLVDTRAREILRQAVKDPDAQVRAAAIRATCEARDPEMLSDILAIAQSAQEPNIRSVALRGYLRLAIEEENTGFTPAQRIEALRSALSLAQAPAEKQLVLAGLARVPEPQTLKLVQPFLDDAEVQAEATQTALQIAGEIYVAQPDLAKQTVRKVALVATDPARRQAAEALYKQINATGGFVTAWQVAGPFQKEGVKYNELFDIPFPPESAEAGANVPWVPLTTVADPKKPWVFDLLRKFGGEQKVAYVRTSIYSTREQTARLEIGSDDGVKAWLNGKLVHANNAARPIPAELDKADVNLKAGWNTLVMKVTQNGMMWEFCVRVIKRDGRLVEAIRFEAQPD